MQVSEFFPTLFLEEETQPLESSCHKGDRHSKASSCHIFRLHLSHLLSLLSMPSSCSIVLGYGVAITKSQLIPPLWSLLIGGKLQLGDKGCNQDVELLSKWNRTEKKQMDVRWDLVREWPLEQMETLHGGGFRVLEDEVQGEKKPRDRLTLATTPVHWFPFWLTANSRERPSPWSLHTQGTPGRSCWSQVRISSPLATVSI